MIDWIANQIDMLAFGDNCMRLSPVQIPGSNLARSEAPPAAEVGGAEE